jgi:hypothetical protein
MHIPNYFIGILVVVAGLLSRSVKVKVYKTILLPVLCGCKIWSLTLREETEGV